MKVRASVKKICMKCKIVHRRGVVRVICFESESIASARVKREEKQMARIAGVDLPPNKRLWVGLTAIYGIGQQRARSLAEKAKVDATKK